MKVFWKYFPLLPVCFVACISIYLVEGLYCQLVTDMYFFFGSAKIDFVGGHYIPGAEFFIATFGTFCTFIAYRIISRPESATYINFLMAVILFFITTTLLCYVDTASKAITCTVCDSNRRFVFNNHNISYNLIFVFSLIVALCGFIFYNQLSSILLPKEKRTY